MALPLQLEYNTTSVLSSVQYNDSIISNGTIKQKLSRVKN